MATAAGALSCLGGPRYIYGLNLWLRHAQGIGQLPNVRARWRLSTAWRNLGNPQGQVIRCMVPEDGTAISASSSAGEYGSHAGRRLRDHGGAAAALAGHAASTQEYRFATCRRPLPRQSPDHHAPRPGTHQPGQARDLHRRRVHRRGQPDDPSRTYPTAWPFSTAKQIQHPSALAEIADRDLNPNRELPLGAASGVPAAICSGVQNGAICSFPRVDQVRQSALGLQADRRSRPRGSPGAATGRVERRAERRASR